MAERTIESLQLQMSADLRRFEKSMDRMRQTADRRLNEVEKRALQSDKRLAQIMGRAGENMAASLKQSLTSIAPTIAAAFSVGAVLKFADAYTALQNRLKAAGLEGEALKRVEDSLYEAANRNGVAVEATAELYQRAAMARRNLGASEEQLLALVSGTSAALKLQGTSATEASGALLQLGQILGGEKVQAQEYNSLIDQLPVLLQAAADGSSRFGGEISTLTQQVKAGKVTTQEFFAALLKGLGDVEARAASATPTLGAAFQTLNNELGRFVGQTDSGLSATQRMAQAVVALADNLDTVVLVVGAVATLMGGRFVLAMTAGSGAMIANGVAAVRLAAFQTAMTASLTGTTRASLLATTATRGFTAALAANPIGAAIIAVAALAAGLMYLARAQSDAEITAKAQAKAMADAQPATTELERLVRSLATANDEETASIRRKIAALLDEQRLKAQMARNAYLEAKAEARSRPVTTAAPSLSVGGLASGFSLQPGASQAGGTVIGPNGNPIDPVKETTELRRLRAEADAAEDSLARLKATAEEATPPRLGLATATPTGGGSGGASGPTPEDLARQRDQLDLQAEIALLRAQDRAAEADARQDVLDTLNLTKQYEEAGFGNARAKAEAQVQALAAARETNRQAEEAARLAEGEARAIEMTRGFVLEMLELQDRLALTDRDALEVRREILTVRQAERRAALETAAADQAATEAERSAARQALDSLPSLERGEDRDLDSTSAGARDVRSFIGSIREDDPVARAEEAYAEIQRLREEDEISEREAAAAKAEVDAEYRASRLSGTRSMLDVISTLQNSSNKKLAALGKAAAIAQATIDGYLAIQKAWSSAPFPANLPAVAITTAAVGANVAAIAGMADGGLVTGPGGPREDRVLRRLSPGEFVVNARSTAENRALLEQINRGGIPGLANGGMVSRAASATARVTSARREPGSSFSYAPTIHAPGADMAAVRAIEGVLAEHERTFADRVNAVRDRRAYYQLGTRRRR